MSAISDEQAVIEATSSALGRFARNVAVSLHTVGGSAGRSSKRLGGELVRFTISAPGMVVVATAIAILTLEGSAQQLSSAQPQTPPVEAASTSPSGDGTDSEWTRWTNGRYRITPGDVLDLTFPFVPELTQTVAVQPDGYVSLKDARDIRAQGRTVAQLRQDVLAVYMEFVREPVFTLTLKEFERPYFLANGEVHKPGRYELRGATTLTQAVAIAGGFTHGANTSRVVLYRHFGESGVEARQIDVGRMFAKKDLSEDPLLRPGDTIVVPRSVLGKMLPILDIWRW